MKPLEALKYYEAEKPEIKVSHQDFYTEDNNDYITEKGDLTSFLLSKNWEDVLVAKTLLNELKTINFIFEECYKLFSGKMDSMEMFSLITDFYNLDYKTTYEKLLLKNRKILILDLEKISGTKILCNENILNEENSSPSSTLDIY